MQKLVTRFSLLISGTGVLPHLELSISDTFVFGQISIFFICTNLLVRNALTSFVEVSIWPDFEKLHVGVGAGPKNPPPRNKDATRRPSPEKRAVSYGPVALTTVQLASSVGHLRRGGN